MKPKYFKLLIAFLFIFRVVYGLCSEFWFIDELQIYLIGLKSYTTGTWPYYGPDVVYTNTQIPGALQGLLVGTPFYILKIPESPSLLLNILSFCSLGFLAYYISRRVTMLPKWFIYTLVLTTPWALFYSTRVINPSYALVFSIPFFLSVIELLPIYTEKIISSKAAFFIMGITTTLIMQLHLSFVLLLPYTGFVFLIMIRTFPKKIIVYTALYLIGIAIGLSTVIPTWIHPGMEKSVQSNILFNMGNIKNIVTIPVRFLSYASFEIPYMLGGHTAERLAVVRSQIWIAPFAAVLLIAGFLQIGLFIVSFFLNNGSSESRKIKWFTFLSSQLVFLSFFFSIKGPDSHTFYLMLPIPLLYSFYCYQWLVTKVPGAARWLKIFAVCGLFFHVGLGINNYKYKSLYVDRAKVQHALDKMDYKILGLRRADTLGYGY